MPTYEYECTSCGHLFEVFQKMSDPPVDSCPKCGGKSRRLIKGGSGIIFKGSGFYVTDTKKSQQEPASSENICSCAKSEGANPDKTAV